MGFESGMSDKEVAGFLEKTAGIPKRTAADWYLDLVGVGEMAGLAQIAKGTAVREMAASGKAFLKKVNEELPSWTSAQTVNELVGKTIGKFIRGIRRVPQEVLDPLESVNFEKMGEVAGRVRLNKAEMQFNPTIGPKAVYKTVGHEITHVEDLKPLLGIKSKTTRANLLKRNPSVSQTRDEAEDLAYGVMDEVGKLISKNELDYDKLKTIIGEFTAAKEPENLKDLVRSLGGEIFEVKLSPEDILKQAKETKSLTKDAFALGREIHAGNVDVAAVKTAHKQILTEGGGKVENAELIQRSQYMNEALEFAEILGGKTKGLEGKVKLLKQIGYLPKD